jgi:hypothetical protein
VSSIEFKDFPWIAPWQPISERGRGAYELELLLEVGPGHPLFEVPVRALARTSHDDDILFALDEHPAAFAVVHLTFRGRRERESKWPSVVLFRDLDHWVTQGMLRDAARFEIDQSNQAA